MNKKERKIIEEIYKDCLKQKRYKYLTKFGAGELFICKVLLKKIKKL